MSKSSADDAVGLAVRYIARSKEEAATSRRMIVYACISAAIALKADPGLRLVDALKASQVRLGTAKLIARIAPRLAADETLQMPETAEAAAVERIFSALESQGAHTTTRLMRRYRIAPSERAPSDPVKRLQSALEKLPAEVWEKARELCERFFAAQAQSAAPRGDVVVRPVVTRRQAGARARRVA